MKFNAFDTLAGSSFGTWTPEETAKELIEILREHGADQSILDLAADIDPTYADELIDDIIDGLIDDCNELLELPECCSICWEDNEIRVIPYLDEQYPRLDELPEKYVDSVVYVVSDHGNVDCYAWNGSEYIHQWGMV